MKMLSDRQLVYDLEILRHGGPEAVTLFFEMAAKCHNNGGDEYLTSWVGAASPALPEADRHAILVGLLQNLFGDHEVQLDLQHDEHTRP
jgi:hypothetical protein